MVEILRNKNLTTRFQIMVEIAYSGPNIQQREIARKLDITPQAVSEYVARLIEDGMLFSEGRSRYRLTNEGVDWIIKSLKELSSYSAFIEKAITSITVSTAIAEKALARGQKVGLMMKNGLLYATEKTDADATGTAVTDAGAGEDVGINGIEGIVAFKPGKVAILRLPGIQRGGSRKTDLARLRKEVARSLLVIAVGLEAFAALKNTGADFHMYGAIEAAVEAAKSGLNPLVVCVENETSTLIGRLEEEKIGYELVDISCR